MAFIFQICCTLDFLSYKGLAFGTYDVHLLLGLISDADLGVDAGDLERSSLFVSSRKLRILASSSYLRLPASEFAADDLDLGADMTRLR